MSVFRPANRRRSPSIFRRSRATLTHNATVTANPASTTNTGSDFYLIAAPQGLLLYPGEPVPEGSAEKEITAGPFGVNESFAYANDHSHQSASFGHDRYRDEYRARWSGTGFAGNRCEFYGVARLGGNLRHSRLPSYQRSPRADR